MQRLALEVGTASGAIVYRLYPEDDDTAFNEIRGASSEDFFAGIEELTKTQNKFQQETSKITDDLKEISKNLSESFIDKLENNNRPNTQNKNQQRRNNNNNNKNSGNIIFNRNNFGARGNHQQRSQNIQQNSQNSQHNWRPQKL